MANTKKSLYVASAETIDGAVDLLGNSGLISNADLGISFVGVNQGDAIVLPAGFTEDLYVPATAQEITIATDVTGSTTVYSNDRTMHVTIINVTEGREVFPRRTFSGQTHDELAAAIAGAELDPGDGLALTCVINDVTADATGIKITAPADVVLKVAVNEEMNSTVTENSWAFHKGYTQAEAITFAKDMATQIYGRTNRVGFPIVEPDFGAQLTGASYSLVTFTKQTTRFDKNFGAGYIDEEKIYILHDQAAIASWSVA